MADETNITEIEEWRDVVGWEGLYQVSSHGRVKSIPRMARGRGGCRVERGGKVLKSSVSNCLGHKSVMLCNAGKNKTLLVHILVCSAFHGPKPTPRHQVAHWDGDGGNNHKSNLRWATAKENGEDKARHGTAPRGEFNVNARLNPEKIREIRAKKSAGARSDHLGVEYGVSDVTINSIIAGKTWKHVT